ncbi:MAG: 4Fe-4S binding protein [Bacteroidetes bacterium]|nr:4Fe-4S binding protein [Bacteroidota bacterium]MCL5025519.1 4Fe-4S binding protein [Chloroflexota bacterium]
MSTVASSTRLEELGRSVLLHRDPTRVVVSVCNGPSCAASGAGQVIAAFRRELKRAGLADAVDVKGTCCHGFCARGPLVVVHPERTFYRQVTEKDVPEIVDTTLAGKGVVDRLLYIDPATGEKIVHEYDVPFYKRQLRILSGNNELIDPVKIEDYIALGGYSATAAVLDGMTPQQVIDELKRAGLRGRGGAGFPTWRKWQACHDEPGPQKYVICNADEGDPGAFMDRTLLEGNPHSIIEGMLIGGYAVGAREGYLYVRNEYPLALQHAAIAVRQAEELGLLGEHVLGSDYSFRLHLIRGGGAFVCGESTALVASIEGRPGEPRAKHVHLAENGLWDRPTVLNNVKTWANVPIIMGRGAGWYSQIGTETSKGTMIFSLVGKIVNTGLVEVPMGITLREMVYDIGGGIPNGRRFKAVQTGGPSGGVIPEEYLDVPVDYEQLSRLGSMMGSGGMIVMDEDTCMVDIAKYFLSFCKFESCGKCTACREGIKRMLQMLTDISEGRGREGDLERLETLANVVADASLCGLGQSAPNPVLTTLRYFRSEYEAHIREKRCPAGACRALISYEIVADKCNGCGVCRRECPEGAIGGERRVAHVIDADKCIKCGACYQACRFDAVRIGGRDHVHASCS